MTIRTPPDDSPSQVYDVLPPQATEQAGVFDWKNDGNRLKEWENLWFPSMGDTPSSLDGLFHGKSQSKMDDD